MSATTHLDGTNGRTFCGIKKKDSTNILPEEDEMYRATCQNCLGKLSQDSSYAEYCFDKLKNIEAAKKE